MGIFYVLLTATFGIIGNVFAKEWANKPNKTLYVLAVCAYIAGSLIFPLSLKYGSLTLLNTLAALIPLITTVAIGLWWYKESLSSLNVIGIGLGIIATILLSIPAKA